MAASIWIIIMDMTVGTAMTEARSLIQLMTWLSPSFPVGAFAYSSGLEFAVAEKWLTGPDELQRWLETLLESGALWNDGVFVSLGWQHASDAGNLKEINGLALAMAGSSGRYLETGAQGSAFATALGWEVANIGNEFAYPVILGAAAGHRGIGEIDTIAAFLNAAVTSQAQAAIRLGVTGQGGGVRLLDELQPKIIATAQKAASSSIADLSGSAMLAEIAAINQETMTTRLFRS
jgi:urease accessory protein